MRKSTKTLLNFLCTFLIALAPVIIEKTNCILVWGEPECPDALKELYSDK
ncbi:cyclic lactone autoinducer peptide [Tissierella sp. Yu-01]|jgi:cyclic lactone autoinducer peptide|nr:cyclic lactone autoinducer peptide [Tissierella sp. Yu-01]WFA09983.1 cyclic lactone autoinducer peptide [Tissierella sp. Yu-01]